MNNAFVPPALIFSSAISSFGPTGALGTEIFVPETEMEGFINRTVTFINAGRGTRGKWQNVATGHFKGLFSFLGEFL